MEVLSAPAFEQGLLPGNRGHSATLRVTDPRMCTARGARLIDPV